MGKILIPYSGGADSFALAIHCLDKGNAAVLLHIEPAGMHYPGKTLAERIVCLKQLTVLKEKYPMADIKMQLLKIKHEMNSWVSTAPDSLFSDDLFITPETKINQYWDNVSLVGFASDRRFKFAQQQTWIYALSMALSDDITEVWMGLVSGDQSLRYYDAYQNLWKALTSFGKNYDAAPLLFPFEDAYKDEVIKRYLPSDLLSMTWTCEQPIFTNGGAVVKQCGECRTCKSLKGSLLHLPSNYSEDYWSAHEKGLLIGLNDFVPEINQI